MPRWTFFMLVMAFVLRSAPPHVIDVLGALLFAPANSFVDILRLHLDRREEANATIIALQKRVADLEEEAILAENLKRSMIKRETFDSALVSYNATTVQLWTDITTLENRLEISQDANIALQRDLDTALYNIIVLENLGNVKKQRATEELHKAEMVRKNEIIVACNTQITELTSMISSLKTQYSDEEQGRFTYYKAQRECQQLLDARDIEIDVRDAKIYSLEIEVQHKNTTLHQLEQQMITFNNLKELLLRLAESGDQRQRIAVIICIAYFLSCGLGVTELGIDPLQLQTYCDWAASVIDNRPSPLAPTEGLRLKDVRYTLSRSFDRDGETLAANELFFPQPLTATQPHPSPSQHTETVFAKPTLFLNGAENVSFTTLAQPSTSSTDIDNSTHNSTERNAPSVTSLEPIPKPNTASPATSQQLSTSSAANNSTTPSAPPDNPETTSPDLFIVNLSPNPDSSIPTSAPLRPAASAEPTNPVQASEEPETSGTTSSASTSNLEDRTSSAPSNSAAPDSNSTLSSGANNEGDAGSSSTSSLTPQDKEKKRREKKKNVNSMKHSDPLAGINKKLGGGIKKRR
ncbi:hypothetical protein N0V95_008012 [Ascochyta clinopodiicola]|nr:hypothetical protein N0V95_008012 [Ascochyta clinopodiicola]